MPRLTLESTASSRLPATREYFHSAGLSAPAVDFPAGGVEEKRGACEAQDRDPLMTDFRVAVIAAAVASALALTAIGGLAWVIADPQYWFPGAYEEKGERGDPGPRGPVGPRGPAGPVGPGAASAIEELSASVASLESDLAALQDEVSSGDLATRVEELESRVDDVESGVSEVESAATDVASKVEEICSQFSLYEGALADIYLLAC